MIPALGDVGTGSSPLPRFQGVLGPLPPWGTRPGPAPVVSGTSHCQSSSSIARPGSLSPPPLLPQIHTHTGPAEVAGTPDPAKRTINFQPASNLIFCLWLPEHHSFLSSCPSSSFAGFFFFLTSATMVYPRALVWGLFSV